MREMYYPSSIREEAAGHPRQVHFVFGRDVRLLRVRTAVIPSSPTYARRKTAGGAATCGSGSGSQ